MKLTNLEKSLVMSGATDIIYLENMIGAARHDDEVTHEMLALAIALKDKIGDAIEEYSAATLKIHGIED